MSVNEKQIGGTHYRSEYQHWDWVQKVKLPYLEGCATKYICRWWKKNGQIDLVKATHYVEKIQSLFEAGSYSAAFDKTTFLDVDYLEQELTAFARANDLERIETRMCRTLMLWKTSNDLRTVRHSLFEMAANPQSFLGGRTPAQSASLTTGR